MEEQRNNQTDLETKNAEESQAKVENTEEQEKKKKRKKNKNKSPLYISHEARKEDYKKYYE